MNFQRFFSPLKLCGMPRFQCAACSVFGVRLTPISLCDMLRFMQLDSQQRQIVISRIEKHLAVDVDETFARQVDEFIKEYRPALEALAK